MAAKRGPLGQARLRWPGAPGTNTSERGISTRAASYSRAPRESLIHTNKRDSFRFKQETLMTPQTSNRKRTLPGRTAVLAACVLLSGSLGVAAAAVPGEEVPTMVVAYGDLDLGTESGVRALYSRITFAASHVCPFQGAMDPARVTLFKSCRDAAITRAVSEIKSPQLAALRAEHAKRG